MPVELFQRYRVIDVDTHLTEPPDLWTSRVSSKWGEAVPHVENVGGTDLWLAAGTFSPPVFGIPWARRSRVKDDKGTSRELPL